MSRSVIVVTWVALLVVGGQASACGESLFRVGKGVIYREYTAPLPGRILVVASTENELAMVDVLRRAGHRMEVVDSAEQVGDSLATGEYDIVMSYFSDHEVIEREVEEVGVQVAQLPVAGTAAELSGARAVNRNALKDDDSVKQFLLAIHRTLKTIDA